ncbi:MAG TPA: ABC transporter permease [Candidatus Acidoferrales bacterium]|nr:ABC transporter permease [Candidatus Acidoferrales bacterium]
MSLWRQLTRGLRVLTNRKAADQDLADEVQDYLEQATAAHVAAGLSPEAARRAAQLEYGNQTQIREEARSYGWENALAVFFADLRYAARRLRRSPGFTLASVVTLALGIGASTAIFSAVNPILFEPLPYPQPGRILVISDYGSNESPIAVTFGTFRELLQRSRSFQALAVLRIWQPTISSSTQPERLEGQRVSAGYFRALGISPRLGRDFEPSEDVLNGPNVVILSDSLWRRRFGRDPAIVGRAFTLNDELFTVVGVMPASFENVLAPSAELWAPLQYDTILRPQGKEWGHHLRMVGRLLPGVSTEQARRELDSIAHSPLADFPRVPWASLESGLIVASLQGDVTRAVRPALLAFLGAVALVLLIACVNVTNLLLARGAQRRGEFAMRIALGAPRSRLVRQLLTESLLLAALGGLLGLVVAKYGIAALVALSPAGLPRVDAIGLSGAVFAFALAVTTLVGLAVGLVPAVHASRHDPRAGLQQSARGTVGGHQWTRRTLVVAEVALAAVLLVSAGLLLRSLERLFAVDLGFRPANLLTMQVQESGHRFDNDAAGHQFFAQALEAVRRVPGVTQAAFTSQLPLSGDLEMYGVGFENEFNPQDDHAVFRYAVTPDYFAAIGIPLRSGRLLDSHDTVETGGPRAVLISESLARRKFPGKDPLGRGVRIGPGLDKPGEPWAIIVGVVGDVRQTSLAVRDSDAIYSTTTQWYWADNPLSLVIRSTGDAAALAPAIRSAIWSVDKDQPIVRVATMDHLVAASEAQRHFAFVVFEVFALVALALAATGIFGVLSGSVTERTREIAVRAALGASRGSIVALVARQGLALTALGAVLGLAGAMAASQALLTLLFGISPLDPITYAAGAVLLAAVAAIACWLPAWRASRVDPAITLREA